jgi:hypothetical protein
MRRPCKWHTPGSQKTDGLLSRETILQGQRRLC